MWVVLLVGVVGVGVSGGGISPGEQGLRWSRGHGAPPLVEAPGPQPSVQDLNATVLAAKLGPGLDPEFMALVKPDHSFPTNAASPTPEFPFRRNRKGRLVPIGEMPKHVRELEVRWVRLGDGTRVRTRVPGKLKRKLQQLVWAVTGCGVAWRWRDLGPRFWPRYLREGACPKASCSIPPGMKCRPAASTHKTLLRWHCRPPSSSTSPSSASANSCTWIKVHYPVVTRCSCACSSS